ncbi:MAG TPA: Pycsar system effector family protein [Arenibacter sp.]|nr:Pycsar system effector family protein [Arenibacter sp.]
MDYTLLIREAADYLDKYMDGHDLSMLRFHNGIHVKEVVEAARKMADHYQLNDRDRAIVLLSAYFHDIGYCGRGREGHEDRGSGIATDFLKEKNVDAEMIAAVRGCILATKMPQSPKNLLEEIVCDADLFHLGSDWFDLRNKLMRQEAAACGQVVDKEIWRKNTIDLMVGHHYHTEYGKKVLEQKKQLNIESLKQKEIAVSTKQAGGMEEDKRKKRPDRGIETMFRITSTNNQRLSDMADNKSNILITVNSIILSVVIALLLRKLDNNAHLIFPTTVLLITSLATMVIAILATRPTIPNGKYTEGDLKNKNVNLLFFGNFHKMDLESYSSGMKLMMEERDYLYSTLIKDVYSQGVVLGRKFKLLRTAYNIFMYGLVVSVLTFVFVVIINS